jgi:hypothetical protein
LFLFAEEIGLFATFCNIMSFWYEELLLPSQPSTVDQPFVCCLWVLALYIHRYN